MIKVVKEYNDSSIQSLSDIQHIRLRGAAYLPDTSVDGLNHVITEIVSNSVDEISQDGHVGGIVEIFMFRSLDLTNYQIVVRDNGRGIPVNRLIDALTSTKTSGKFSTDSYKYSTGSLGFGAKVCASTSNWFRAISLNRDAIGDCNIRYDSIPDQVKLTPNSYGETGMIVMFEPDPTIFSGITDFTEDYHKLINYLSHLSLFANYHILFTVIDDSIPDPIRIASVAQVIEYLNSCRSVIPTFDSVTFDRDRYIKDYFGVQKNWNTRIGLNASDPSSTLSVSGELFVLLTNSNYTNNKLTFINNLLFTDSASIHIKLLLSYMKDKLAPHITDKLVKRFFIDLYKLPIWLVVDVKFSGAVYSGFAKTSFRDKNFIEPYSKILLTLLPDTTMTELYQLLEQHIITMYNRASNNEFKINDVRHIGLKLNRPSKYNDCSTTNRSEAELFLIEGDSAKSDQDRDSSFQASYTLSGKPANALMEPDKLSESVNILKKNLIFQDIIRILNIVPGSDDLSNMNFGKILIMADADTHGYHISNILISNLYALCPALLEQGKVYLVKAPLYGIRVKDSEPVYVRDESELNMVLAHYVYYRCLDITLSSDLASRTLSRDEFIAFSEIVEKIGSELERISQEYMIPAILLEQLSLLTAHLNLAIPDVEKLKALLGYEVRYVKASQLLIFSIGTDDIIVPLISITDIIYQRILPLYREFFYGKIRISVTSKNSAIYNNTPISIVMLYMLFKTMAGAFTTKRYKGLGGMDCVSRARTCVNPATRRVYQIASIGDIGNIFAMMGSDSQTRKRIITY